MLPAASIWRTGEADGRGGLAGRRAAGCSYVQRGGVSFCGARGVLGHVTEEDPCARVRMVGHAERTRRSILHRM